MAQMILHQVIEQIKTLDPSELLHVNRAVQERLTSQEEVRKRQTFYRALLASGLVRQIKTSLPLPVDVSKRRLVQVQGRPISQTIIEERR